MIYLKRCVSLLLLFLTVSSCCIASAANDRNPAPMADHVALDTAITSAGSSWSQPFGYPAYRIWVNNTTSQTMTVTISTALSQSHTFSVPAKSAKAYTVNNASYGRQKISFKTKNNVLSGTVRVRVSSVALH